MEEINIFVNDLIDQFIGITILLVMFSMGLHSTFGEAFGLLREPGRLFRYLISVVVLVPIVAYLGLTIIPDVDVEAQVGLLLLAGAAGNGLVPKLAQKIGADLKEVTSGLIVLSLVTIVSAPIVLAMTIPPEDVSVDGLEVARIVLMGVVIPILVGAAIRQWWVKAAEIITAPLTKLADSLLTVVVLVIIVKDLDAIIDLGLYTLVVFLGFIVVYMAMGHALGSPGLSDRITLGMFTSNRNNAIAMLVAATALPAALGAIVAYAVLALIVDIAYMTLVGRKLVASEPATEPGPTTKQEDTQPSTS